MEPFILRSPKARDTAKIPFTVVGIADIVVVLVDIFVANVVVFVVVVVIGSLFCFNRLKHRKAYENTVEQRRLETTGIYRM